MDAIRWHETPEYRALADKVHPHFQAVFDALVRYAWDRATDALDQCERGCAPLVVGHDGPPAPSGHVRGYVEGLRIAARIDGGAEALAYARRHGLAPLRRRARSLEART